MVLALPPLRVIGKPRDVPSDQQLDAAGRDLGLTLPPSYRAFAKRYGHGLTNGLFMIYVPMDKAGFTWSSGLVDMSRALKGEIVAGVDGGIFTFEPDGSAELVARLVPFGGSENGDILAWDPASPSSDDGERWIYIVMSRLIQTRRVAPDLADLVRRASLENTGGVLDNTEETLPATFEARPGRGRD